MNIRLLESGKSVPKRFDNGQSDGDYHAGPEALYRQGHYNLIITAIPEHFDQPGYKKHQQLKALDKSNKARKVGR